MLVSKLNSEFQRFYLSNKEEKELKILLNKEVLISLLLREVFSAEICAAFFCDSVVRKSCEFLGLSRSAVRRSIYLPSEYNSQAFVSSLNITSSIRIILFLSSGSKTGHATSTLLCVLRVIKSAEEMYIFESGSSPKQ